MPAVDTTPATDAMLAAFENKSNINVEVREMPPIAARHIINM
ncbi:hypothetical protein [Sinobaca sp. H24]|nr:hypothetical protein [Sinobaca sp. H24]